MRIALFCLLALLTVGCVQTEQPSSLYTSAKLYKSEAELAGARFEEIGLVAGDSCQFTPQDSPPSTTAAMLDLQKRAAQKNANAVLLHRCELMMSVPGCYRASICEGSALRVAF